ncbi:hypothetical protein R3P38DRAFT_3594992 [Favolaschia claudopus]|uniref:RING-type domain-containing protein n=1 Tax=Favolaschia claudopus TaxID=2862362 RepID=A0AAW0DKX2_9AGAR
MDIDHNTNYDSDDDMPALQSVSNSSDSEGDDDDYSPPQRQTNRRSRASQPVVDDDDDNAWTDVEDEDDEMPALEPINAPETAANSGRRRRRTGDDTEQDRDRDRRHPSQRVNGPPNIPTPNANVNNNTNTGNTNNNGGNNPNMPFPGAPPQLAQLFTFLARIGAAGPNGGVFGAGDLPPNMGHFVFGGGPPPPPPKDSPENAARIIAGLERVPEGLVRRLERVSKLGKSTDESEELGAAGGDSGCAICWDKLLDGDGAEFASSSTTTTTAAPATTSPSDSPPEGITALPCAHVFHSACLLPWFSRPGQTTCPTCRFDVDPKGIIWYGGRKQDRERGGLFGGLGGPGADWAAFARGRFPFPVPQNGNPGGGPQNAAEGGLMPEGFFGPRDGDIFNLLEEEDMLADEIEAFATWGDGQGLGESFSSLFDPDSPIVSSVFPVDGRMLNPLHLPAFHPGPPPNNGDDDDGDDLPPPLEPIPGRAPGPAHQQTQNDDDDLPPLEPISVRATSSNSENNNNNALPPPPPLVNPAPVTTTTTNPNSNPNLTPHPAPPPAPPSNTFTFGLDIVFSTLGPIPPPADLGGVTNGLPPNPAVTQQQAPPAPGAATPSQPANAQPPPPPQFTFGPLRGGVGLGAGGVGALPGFAQLFRGFGAGAPAGGAAPAPAPAAGGGGGGTTTFHGIQIPLTVPPFVFGEPAQQQQQQPQDPGMPAGAGEQQQGQAQQQQRAQAAAVLRALGLGGILPAGFEGGAAGNEAGDGAGGDQQAGVGGQQMFGLNLDDFRVEIGTGVPPWLRPPQPGNANAETGAAANNGTGMQMPPGMVFEFPFGRGAPAAAPPAGNAGAQNVTGNGNDNNNAANPPPPPTIHVQHIAGGPMPLPPGLRAFPRSGMPPPPQDAQTPPPPPPPQQDWAPPPAPGPTLRDRVERREREAGLRCWDKSCEVGPSDEDPFVEVGEEGGRVVGIRALRGKGKDLGLANGEKGGEGEERGFACAHTFHVPCLVSAQRARLGWREPVIVEGEEDAEVEVVCSVCRADGTVAQAEWLAR